MDSKKDKAGTFLTVVLLAALMATLLVWAERPLAELFLWAFFDPETAGWQSF